MSQEPNNYRVSLDVYTGPLDLLLYLIRREEVDIQDIPISRITAQYIEHVDMLRSLDPDSIGQFLVLAATLMEIKSRMLLPTPPQEVADEDAIDPRADLVRQLLEYKRFKDAAEDLQHQGEQFSKRFPRAPGLAGTQDPYDLEDAEVWDLLAAFNNLMLQTGRSASYQHQVVYDDTPIATHALGIVDHIQKQGGSVEFASLFSGKSRPQCVGLFLALLELIRRKRVRADQDHPFGQIYVFLLDARPLTAPEVSESFGPEGTAGPALAGEGDVRGEERGTGGDEQQTEESGEQDTNADEPAETEAQRPEAGEEPTAEQKPVGEDDDAAADRGQAQDDGVLPA